MFVLGFLAFALLNTAGLLPACTLHLADHGLLHAGDRQVNIAGMFEQVSKFCITISMAGVGLETKLSAMRQTGLKPFVASLIAVVIVAIMVLFLIQTLGIGAE